MICKLALEDGCVFTGLSFGAVGTQTGEVVFNTSMTGYQEICTDPSYRGQIVTMTFPLIGNYGVNPGDAESSKLHLSALVVKELPRRPSNFRATASLAEFLKQNGILGLAGVDTRALTRRLRIHGSLRGAISTEILNEAELVKLAVESKPMIGCNLVDAVAATEYGSWSEPLWSPPEGVSLEGALPPSRRKAERTHVVVLDCGIKQNILRYLVDSGCRVTLAPPKANAAALLDLDPEVILVGNGPGDPAAVTETIDTLKSLLGRLPMIGICLGHQMLGLALGAQTYKLRFGHHGANVPVLNHTTGGVEITSQNHGFAVDRDSLERAGGKVTHVNLNDGSVEGFSHPDLQIVTVQFHPEASPGPHDSGNFFELSLSRISRRSPVAV